jgi:hypothetical protein
MGQVARFFARNSATIGTLIARLAERMAEDEKRRQEIDKLNKKVKMSKTPIIR